MATNERLAAQNNGVVPPGLKLEFVLDELQRLRSSDPPQAEYINSQIASARRIMMKEMQTQVAIGLGIESADHTRVDAIIEKLFLKFVCRKQD